MKQIQDQADVDYIRQYKLYMNELDKAIEVIRTGTNMKDKANEQLRILRTQIHDFVLDQNRSRRIVIVDGTLFDIRYAIEAPQYVSIDMHDPEVQPHIMQAIYGQPQEFHKPKPYCGAEQGEHPLDSPRASDPTRRGMDEH